MGTGSLDIWKSLAGIAIFLMGMNFLESSLKKLAGRSFKLFLKKQTTNKVKAIFGSAIVTGVLQSSSIVNLITLAFVGAGVINMQNALAVMLGANLGTTLDSWLVASVGFSTGIENFSLPVTAIAGIAAAIFNKESKWYYWSNMLLGLGLLFIGLNFMRTGIEASVNNIDFATLNTYPIIVFLLIGLIITSLIQSSSATIAIVLSALHANAIGLYAATAIVLGSEIGTTLKLLIASAGGIPAKKRVALGNFLFNVITSILVIIFLHPIINLITDVVGIKNNLIALVAFQTFVNILGIVLFFPFLNSFGRILEKLFTKNSTHTLFISKTALADTDIALDAMKDETKFLMYQVIGFCLEAFGIDNKDWQKTALDSYAKHNTEEKYNHIKEVYGDIHAFFIELQNRTDSKTESEMLEKLMFSVRNAMYAAKNTKDILHDIEQLSNSSNDVKYSFFMAAKEKAALFYKETLSIIDSQDANGFEKITKLYNSVQEDYTSTLKSLYESPFTQKISDVEISTILNFNRELYSSFKSMVIALKDYSLNEKDADYFDDLPGFIR